MVYYRKYRPQTIAELDSAKLRETLTAVLSREEIPHAFLLTGPKGLGKTSTARIIAKVVNCVHKNKGSIEPCNTCEQCVSITSGSNMDVLEIDGASNRGIDEIRDLRDKVKLAPSSAKKKVYIIDEVHMLTTEAFNALLKTVEEPPAHVMFIFCTTEPQKVPATILSRCFHVGYTLATEEDLVRSFKRVVEGEKIAIDEEALHDIARLSEGGFRDGTKILEELVMLAEGKTITKSFIEEHYTNAHVASHVSTFLMLLLQKKQKEIFALIEEMVQQGVDMKYFLASLLSKLHETLLQTVEDPKNSIMDSVTIQDLVAIFSEAYQETKYAIVPQLPLELAVVAWCVDASHQSESAEASQEGEEADLGSKSGMAPEDKLSFASRKSEKQEKHTMETLLKKEKNLKVQSLLRGVPAPTVEKKKEKEAAGQEVLSDKAASEQFMENLIYKVKPINFSIAGVLRGCVIKKLDSGEVTFQTSYKFHKERLEEGKAQEILEKAIKEITGKSLKVMVELKNKDNI